jgi:hypothetical protein
MHSSFNATLFRRSMLVLVAALFLGTSLFSLHGAAKADSSTDSYVRIIHASPYIGVADVFVDGSKLLSSFPFADVTPYTKIPAGAHKVQISLVGKGINAAVINQNLTVEAGKTYTVAAVGATPDKLGVQVFVDDNSVATNEAKVRVYHLSPDAGTVSVKIGEDDTVNGVAYEQGSNYVTVDQGPCTFALNDPQYNKTISLSATLNPNTVTSVFVVGLFDGTPAIKLITAQTNGIPGLPQTGSDPVVQDTTFPVSSLWLFLAAAVVMAGVVTWRFTLKKRLS